MCVCLSVSVSVSLSLSLSLSLSQTQTCVYASPLYAVMVIPGSEIFLLLLKKNVFTDED